MPPNDFWRASPAPGTAAALSDPIPPSPADDARKTAWRRAWRVVFMSSAVGLLLAFAGAFDTQDLPWPDRGFYWVGLLGGGSTMGFLIGDRWMSLAVVRRNLWLAWAAISISIAAPMTLLVALVNGAIGQQPNIVVLFPTVLTISALTTAIGLITTGAEPVTTHAAAPGAAAPKFLERLPLKLRGAELYAVEAQDHYLRLHTSAGQDLILMRLSDAVAELEGIEGARVHRSWWVAKAAVVDAERGEGRATLTLKDGSTAPVSRAYARNLRAGGWF